MAEIFDLDVFAPKTRQVKFTDRNGNEHTFDASFTSFRSSMYFLAHMEEFRALTTMKESEVDQETFRLILGIVEDVAKNSDKSLTVDFLYDNLSVIQGVKLLEFVMIPIVEYLQSNPPKADAEAEVPSA